MTDTMKRKDEHLDIALNQSITMGRSGGFDEVEFRHRALPEVDYDRISLRTTFLGRELAAPFIISSMTGGTERGKDINRHLAEAAREMGLIMGVGSQRVMLEDPSTRSTFRVVRDVAPDLYVLGNLGAVQLNYGLSLQDALDAADVIRADGLFLHMNPLQEVIQSGGNTDFSGLLDRIGDLATHLPIPLLAKEVGCGIDPEVATRLVERGISALDISGAGGTSWAAIEGFRTTDPARKTIAQLFANWGIPTAQSLRLCRSRLPTFPLIASGGIRHGLDAAKALALGANLVGLARPLLEPATTSTKAVIHIVQQWMLELRVAMFLVGAPSIESLRVQPLYDRGFL